MNILNKRTIALVTVLGLIAAGFGCELVVNFDRSKIPNDAGLDAPFTTDMGAPDAPATDSPVSTDSPSESASDASVDGSMESGTETGTDSGMDSTVVDGSDAGVDSPPDAPPG